MRAMPLCTGCGATTNTRIDLSRRGRMAMKYKQASEKLEGYRKNIAELRAKMRATLAEAEPEEVQDYAFATVDGTRKLSELFGRSDELFMIHNMGRKCPFCTP